MSANKNALFEEIGYKAATNKICRLCLKSCENSIPIFESITILEKALKECLEDIGRISLSPLDNLPETVCQPCYKTFAESYSFVTRIRKNDEFLHNIVVSTTIKCVDVASHSNLPANVTDTDEEQLILQDHGSENQFNSSAPEEGEVPQYIEIAYIQPSAQFEPTLSPALDELPTNNGAIQCSYCCKTFSSLRYKRDHERIHFENGRKCPHCDRCFLKKCDWTRHVNSHTLAKTFKCTLCEKVFFSLAELNRHMKVHNPARDHKCEHCLGEFKDITTLKLHIRSVHFKERPYCCPNCGSAFSTASKVRRHQRSKICSEAKTITTVHHGCGDEFLIYENKYHISNCLDGNEFILDNGEDSLNNRILDSSS